MEWLPSPLATIAAWALIATFGWAVVAKSMNPAAWSAAVAGFGFRASVGRVIAVAVPVVEAAVVLLFLLGHLRAGGALTLALVASFSAAIVRARSVGKQDKVPCGCFGGTGRSDYRLLLARNGGLALLAALLLLSAGRTSLGLPANTEMLPTFLVVAAGVLIVWMTTQAATVLRKR